MSNPDLFESIREKEQKIIEQKKINDEKILCSLHDKFYKWFTPEKAIEHIAFYKTERPNCKYIYLRLSVVKNLKESNYVHDLYTKELKKMGFKACNYTNWYTYGYSVKIPNPDYKITIKSFIGCICCDPENEF